MTTINVPFVRDEWLPALRSGEYQQGQGNLRRDAEYCCLGVACQLLIEKGVLSPWRDGNTPGLHIVEGYSTTLPVKAQSYIGCDTMGFLGNAPDSLVSLNDGGMSFAKIADFIERVWLREEAGDEVGVAR